MRTVALDININLTICSHFYIMTFRQLLLISISVLKENERDEDEFRLRLRGS